MTTIDYAVGFVGGLFLVVLGILSLVHDRRMVESRTKQLIAGAPRVPPR